MTNVMENAKRLYALKVQQALPESRRYLFEKVVASPAKLVAIYGSRGVGKTTMLMQLIAASPLRHDEKLYISCDYSYMQGVGLFEFAEAFAMRGGRMLCIDEVHEAKDFERELKQIYDFLDIRIYFSGSSAIALKSPDFARRYSMFHLAPLSFREYLNLQHNLDLKAFTLEAVLNDHENIVHEILSGLAGIKIIAAFEMFLQVGMYPFYFEDPSRYIDRINDTIDKTLYIDIGRIYSVMPDKVESLKKLIATACVSKPFEFTIDRLAQTIGITKSTLYKYLTYLDKAELIRIVRNEAKRFANVRKSDKLYLANTNLLEAICLNQDRGTLRETFFVSMVGVEHAMHYANRGDFLVDEVYTFEVGGRNKGFEQIRAIPKSYIAADDIETGSGNKIPLWLFGFLY